MTQRSHPGMHHMTTGGEAGNMWTYRTRHPINVIDADGYWDNQSNNLGITDEVKVYAFRSDGGFYRATFVVVHQELNRVIVERETDWRLFSLDVQGVELIDRGMERFDVIETRTGRTLKAGVDRMTANALARAYQREGDPEAEPVERRGPGRPRKEAA